MTDSKAYQVVKLLREQKKKISFAESLTGGMIADTLVSVPHASEVFGYGFVTYSDEAKQKVLDVSVECINLHGAVSKECAEQMAVGAQIKSGADISVSVTGFAGPASGDENEPIGTVYMGLCVNGAVEVRKYVFDGDRQEVRKKTVDAVFKEIIEKISIEE